jgi:hypothetical protein
LEQIKPLYWGDGGTGYGFAVFENGERLLDTWFRPDEVRNFFFYPREGDIVMDPNCCLSEMRKLYKRIIDGETLPDNDMDRLAELIESLDDWLVSGGLLPAEWSKNRG